MSYMPLSKKKVAQPPERRPFWVLSFILPKIGAHAILLIFHHRKRRIVASEDMLKDPIDDTEVSVPSTITETPAVTETPKDDTTEVDLPAKALTA
jgi:hypothetical protein